MTSPTIGTVLRLVRAEDHVDVKLHHVGRGRTSIREVWHLTYDRDGEPVRMTVVTETSHKAHRVKLTDAYVARVADGKIMAHLTQLGGVAGITDELGITP